MSSFGTVTDMRVVPSDPRWPLGQRGDDGIRVYRARVRLASHADFDALDDQFSLVTMKRAEGTLVGTATVHAGPGAATLTVPIGVGVYGSASAILRRFEGDTDARTAGRYEAQCEWVLLEKLA